MRRNLLYVAAGMALLVLTAQVDTWRRVSVHTPTTLANVTNITFVGTVTASVLRATGNVSVGIGVLYSNGWHTRTTPNGMWAIDGNGGQTHLQMQPGTGPRLLRPMDAAGDALATRDFVTNAASTNGIPGLAAFVTSNVPAQVYNTNVWAVFMIEKMSNWTDITLKGHSNFFLIHTTPDVPQFAFTTADAAPNGTPSWENFPAGPWLPHVFFKRSHVSNARTPWIWHRLDTNSTTSISATQHPDWPNPVDGWMICLRINAPWFSRYTNFQWVFNYHNDTASEVDTHGQPLFRSIRPEWVDYDPRPRTGYNWGDGGFRGSFSYASEHQKP